MTLADILETVDLISGRWRSASNADQLNDLARLDTLLHELDNLERSAMPTCESAAELRGRIEILTDEIHISLGIDPPPIDAADDDRILW